MKACIKCIFTLSLVVVNLIYAKSITITAGMPEYQYKDYFKNNEFNMEGSYNFLAWKDAPKDIKNLIELVPDIAIPKK